MPQRTTCALPRAALAAAARGWHVIPLRPGTKRPALHGEARCPRTGPCADGHATWEQRATSNPARIRRAWAVGAFNIGIATGPSGLLVVDLDTAKHETDAPDGATTFRQLAQDARQSTPRTFTVRTASGGTHLYFRAPTDAHLGNTAGTLAPHVDTRGWGGYVVAPGSIVDGAPYDVLDDTPPAPLPPWLRTALHAAHTPRTPVALAAPRNASRVAQVAFTRERQRIATAPEGLRERILFEAARSLGRFIAWGDIDRTVVEEAFQGGGEAAGLTAAECRSTLRSALNWAIRTAHPRPRGDAA